MRALLPLASGLQRGIDAGVISKIVNLAVGLLRVRHRDDLRSLSHELVGPRDLAVDDFRPACGALPRGIGAEHFDRKTINGTDSAKNEPSRSLYCRAQLLMLFVLQAKVAFNARRIFISTDHFISRNQICPLHTII